VQSGVGKLSSNKTALKRFTSNETLWNRKAPSLSSPEDEEIFLPSNAQRMCEQPLRIFLLLLFFKAHQHKAAGRKTRLDILLLLLLLL